MAPLRARSLPAEQREWLSPPLHERLAELVRAEPERVVRLLAPVMSERRRRRIDRVLARRTRRVVVVLDRLRDPHNAAALLRTAEALGVQEVHVIDPLGSLRPSRRVTQGCHKWLDVAVHLEARACIEGLRGRGYRIVGASERAGRAPSELAAAGRVALCLGNEHAGLSEEVERACDERVGIPMVGFSQSLNVSVAGALLLRGLLEGRPRGLDPDEVGPLKARYYALSVRGALEVLEREEVQR